MQESKGHLQLLTLQLRCQVTEGKPSEIYANIWIKQADIIIYVSYVDE